MSQPFRAGLLALCLLLANTASVLVMAAICSKDPVTAQGQATYFTADFLSSHFSYEANRHFDSKPCADRVYASERNRSLRYLFGPTVDKAMNYWEYLKKKTKSLIKQPVEFSIGFYMPFPAGDVYASLKGTSPAADSSLKKSGWGLTTPFDAYISMPSPFVDRAVLNDPEHMFLLEIVCFKNASKSKKEMKPKVSFILRQIKKTGLLEQGQQIRRQQMIAAYLGEHHTQRTYSQRVLEDSKPCDGEEVYWLRLPEKSGPFYPKRFKDPQWTIELVIKFLTYAISPLLKGCDRRSRILSFDDYLSDNGIIPGINIGLMVQPSERVSPLFNHAFVQSQKYRFLEANSTVAVMSYQKSFIGEDVISPPIIRFTETPSIILGARRTLLHGNEMLICVHATIDFIPDYPMKLSSLRQLKMPFRIPKGLASETAKRKEALLQLSEMTELNWLEENFDFEERRLTSNSSK